MNILALRKRRPPWPVGNKLRAIVLEAFVRLFSFPFAAIAMRDILLPRRRCSSCRSRLLTTIDRARVHAQSPNGLALQATPTLHRCLRCHELTVFVSPVAEEGVALPFEHLGDWLEVLFPGMSRC